MGRVSVALEEKHMTTQLRPSLGKAARRGPGPPSDTSLGLTTLRTLAQSRRDHVWVCSRGRAHCGPLSLPERTLTKITRDGKNSTYDQLQLKLTILLNLLYVKHY